MHINEEIADSDSEDLYEDTRSVTPHPRDPPTNQNSSSNHRDVPLDPSVMAEPMSPVDPSGDHVADVSDPPSPLQVSSKENIHSNSDENVHDSNETSDTDFRDNFREILWKNRRFESDLSTAPFSSETSDMDTSGNERILATDGSSNRIGQSKPLIEVQHRQLNSESSGDEVAKRAREVRIVPRPPPKPATLLSNLSNKTVSKAPATLLSNLSNKTVSKAPATAKKALHLTKSSPLSGKVNSLCVPSTQPARNRGSVKGAIPTKPKPPVAAKPKPELKPRPAMATSQQRTTIIPNGVTTSGRPGGSHYINPYK